VAAVRVAAGHGGAWRGLCTVPMTEAYRTRPGLRTLVGHGHSGPMGHSCHWARAPAGLVLPLCMRCTCIRQCTPKWQPSTATDSCDKLSGDVVSWDSKVTRLFVSAAHMRPHASCLQVAHAHVCSHTKAHTHTIGHAEQFIRFQRRARVSLPVGTRCNNSLDEAAGQVLCTGIVRLDRALARRLDDC
jgi:hypothetical protein